MALLFPIKHKQISIAGKKRAIMENIKKHTEKVKKARFVFSNHKQFEGKVFEDKFKLKYIGKLARNYKVEIAGELIANGENITFNVKSSVTTFGKIYTYIWLFVMSLVVVTTLYWAVIVGQLIILTITLFALLLLVLALTVTYNGYKNESMKVLNLIEKIIKEDE